MPRYNTRINKARLIELVMISVNPTYKHRINKYTQDLFLNTSLEQRMQLDKMEVLTRVMTSPEQMKKILNEIMDIDVIYVNKLEHTIFTVNSL